MAKLSRSLSRADEPKRIRDANRRTPLAAVTCALMGVLCVFTSENLGIDSWLKHIWHRLPSFAPEALSGAGALIALIAAMIGIALVLLIFSQILLWKEANAPGWKRALRILAMSVTILLCVGWFVGGQAARAPKSHSLTLHWQASTTPGVKYNVYRTQTRGRGYVKLNPKPLAELTYIDKDVRSGETYYYITRSITTGHKESLNSNEVHVKVP